MTRIWWKSVIIIFTLCKDKYVRFQVLTAASMKFRVFLDKQPSSKKDVFIELTKRQ
jgi:hypothetical protein